MTESTTSTEPLVDVTRLGPALVAATGEPAWAQVRADLIAGGKSNLTYRLTCPAGTLILRRPPGGKLLPKAHDMGREVRVQQALADTVVPVPRIVLFDGSGEILGVPCYVMAEVSGHIVRDSFPPGFATTPDERELLSGTLVDTLADLHAVDAERVGLADFGRPEGFTARQVALWTKQWERSGDVAIPDVDDLARALARGIPGQSRSAIVHGDFRLDNVVLDPRDPGRILAVLDWEMATLGDPLTDLGLLLLYWTEPGDTPLLLTPNITASGGFPGRDFVVERYAARSGIDPSGLAFYEAFARFKLAVIAQGVVRRAESGAMAGQDFGDLRGEVARLATEGLDILHAPDHR